MYADDYARERKLATRRVSVDAHANDEMARFLNNQKRKEIAAYGQKLRTLGYKGDMEEARRIFLNEGLRAKIDLEWTVHEQQRGMSELVMSLDSMAQHLTKRKE
jgi:hypothetical protein